MASHELYAKMEGLWTEFSDNHSKFTDKGNKAAATRARKAVGELKKTVTQLKSICCCRRPEIIQFIFLFINQWGDSN